MKISELAKLSLKEKLDFLNQNHTETPEAIYDQVDNDNKEEFEGICADCFAQTHQKSLGDEGWTVCPGCRNVEQKTYEITVLTDLKVAYIFDTKQWIEADDNIGME